MRPVRSSVEIVTVLLACLIATLYLVETLTEQRFDDQQPLSLAVALVFSATLAAARRAPLLPLLAGLALILVSNRTDAPLADTATFVLGFGIALYCTGRYAEGRVAYAGGLAVVVALPLAAIEPGEPFSLADSAFIAIFIAGPWAAGRVVRHRQQREQGLTEELEAKAVQAVADERARIARELHDVVGHALSVMVLQARGGRRVLASSPDDAGRALTAIDEAGAQALTEMRRLLGVLREPADGPGLTPRPSLARLDDLRAHLAGAGLPVDVTVEGEPHELPPGLDVSAYRIVQEALTNALKHAGPAHAHVIVRYAPDDLELEVLDDGKGTGDGGGSGLGLAGLRERVAVYGGDLDAGRRPEGGYALRARLPLAEAP